MLYLATPSGRKVRDAMLTGAIGAIAAPGGGSRPDLGVPFCLDNGKFGQGWPGAEAWFAWVQTFPSEGCLFVTAPDVVGDAEATLTESAEWLPRIRAIGHRAAFVAQDGLTVDATPWDEFDALFIGGTTDWKLGPEARGIAAEAKRRGKWLHMGRVNSERRYRYAEAIGCDSVDGTFLAFGPDVNLPQLLAWTRLSAQGDLFKEAEL